MKNERIKGVDSFIPDCVHCDNVRIKTLKDMGTTTPILPNGQMGIEKKCDVFELICTIDTKKKGCVFTPYESLTPNYCPILDNSKGNKTNLFKKLKSFFGF